MQAADDPDTHAQGPIRRAGTHGSDRAGTIPRQSAEETGTLGILLSLVGGEPKEWTDDKLSAEPSGEPQQYADGPGSQRFSASVRGAADRVGWADFAEFFAADSFAGVDGRAWLMISGYFLPRGLTLQRAFEIGWIGHVLAVAAAGVPGAALVQAQPLGGAPGSPPTPFAVKPEIQFVPSVVPLHPDSVVLDAVGLTLRVPLGVKTQTTESDGVISMSIAAPDGSWLINVQTPPIAPGKTTAVEVADSIIQQFNAAMPIRGKVDRQTLGSAAYMLEPRRQISTAGSKVAAERFYFGLPGKDLKPMVQGYTIFQPLPDRFVIFELVCPETALQPARSAYEVMIAAATFEDPEKIIAKRRDAVSTGVDMLAKMTPAAWMEVLPEQARWERLYRPAFPGAPDQDAVEEGGYRIIRFIKGTRAQLADRASAARPGPANPEGILAQVDARLYLPQSTRGADGTAVTTNQIVDSEATYFISTDRSEEAWTIRMSVLPSSPGQRPSVHVETGARSGKTLTVATSTPGAEPKTIRAALQGEGYLSQVEALLWPRVLARRGAVGEVGTYTYRSDAGGIVLRRDSVLKDPKGREMLVVATRHRDEPAGSQTVLTSEGETLRIETTDHRVWEPTAPTELMSIYKAKGLPTGSGGIAAAGDAAEARKGVSKAGPAAVKDPPAVRDRGR
ncbi:hypothetical protein BH11PLA1_BH11PLA1_22650 [soil metagenome]